MFDVVLASAPATSFAPRVASLADREARGTGAPGLGSAPMPLVASALDEALSRAGLGRLALDLTPRADRGVLGCLVRPALDVGVPSFVALYEGLLEVALGAALGEALAVRCLEDGERAAVPWRFAIAPVGEAAQLAAMAGERADDVARRLGLLEDEGV